MPTSVLYARIRRCASIVAATTRSAVRSAFGQHIWIIGIFFALLSLVYTSVVIQGSRRSAVAYAGDDTRGLGIIMAEQTSRYLQVLDLLLQQTQAHIQTFGIRTPEQFKRLLAGEEIHQFLAERMMNLPQGQGVALFDADGSELNSSHPLVTPFSIAQRKYFQRLRGLSDGNLVVGRVTARHSTGTSGFLIGRRISTPDGTFLGAVVTATDSNNLYNFYRAIDYQHRLAVTLRRRDGFALVRYPATSAADQAMPATASWFALVAAGGGTYNTSDDSIAAGSIMSVNPTPNYPLVLDVAVSEENMLKTWHDQAVYTVADGVAFAIISLAIFALIGRQMRRQKEQNVTLSRTTAMLGENERRFRDFSELASDWFWEQDAELRFTAIGLDERRTVHDRESPIGKRRWELNNIDSDPERWEDHRRTVLAHEPFRDFHFEQTDGDGRPRHVTISGVPVHDQAGTFIGYRGIGRDITAQIEAERDLREAKEHAEHAEALLQDAIDSVADGFVICDAGGRQVVCNEGYRRLYRYQTDFPWAAGHTREDILRQGLANGRYPDAIGHDQAWYEGWLRRNLNVPSSMELPLADGRWLLVTEQRMRSGGIAALLVDITTLKQAQAALRDSEAGLERAQEIAKIGSWELNVATGEIVWSKQLYRMRGLPLTFKPTLANMTPRLHPTEAQRMLDWFADLAAGRQREPIEFRAMLPNGEERVAINEGRPVVDPDGVIRHVVGTAQDISERRLIERTLAQSQKMDALGQLTGGMAHDFNNMLGVIIGNLDLVKPLLGADALASDLCAEARDGAVRCADLIRRLLAFARRQALHSEQTDVNALISDVCRLLGRTLGEHITLTLEFDATLRPVKVDPAQLEAALINLATNARDAMPKGGQLTFATHNATLDAVYASQHADVAAGDYALIEISDTGTGIPPDIITRIFDPFFTTKASGKGTGLGLSMTFGFVKQSGGHLSVYSELGRGTTFRLYLPRSDSDEAAAVIAPGSDVIVGGDETILVVEDNAQLRRTAERQLTELGYQVRLADGAQPALTLLSGTDAVDLLFTDIVMPGTLDGLDLTYQAMRLRPGLKVLLTSGFPGGRGADQRMADSPYRLLGKPYSLMELAQTVRMVLDNDGNATGPAGGPAPS